MNEYPPSHNEATLTLDPHTRTILESISDGFVLLDTAWRIMYMNPQAESILDRTREEPGGDQTYSRYHVLCASKCRGNGTTGGSGGFLGQTF